MQYVSSLLSLHCIFALQIEQDFRLLFGEATANKFLEKWANDLKTKVITESHGLVPTTELLDLMRNAESTAEIENGMTGTVFNCYFFVIMPIKCTCGVNISHFTYLTFLYITLCLFV